MTSYNIHIILLAAAVIVDIDHVLGQSTNCGKGFGLEIFRILIIALTATKVILPALYHFCSTTTYVHQKSDSFLLVLLL